MIGANLTPRRWLPDWLLEAVILGLVALFMVIFFTGCTAVPATPTAKIPVPVAVDCKYPQPGPRPDLSALASLSGSEPPQQIISIMGAALAALAEDDARLRTLMNHGN